MNEMIHELVNTITRADYEVLIAPYFTLAMDTMKKGDPHNVISYTTHRRLGAMTGSLHEVPLSRVDDWLDNTLARSYKLLVGAIIGPENADKLPEAYVDGSTPLPTNLDPNMITHRYTNRAVLKLLTKVYENTRTDHNDVFKKPAPEDPDGGERVFRLKRSSRSPKRR